MFESNHTLRELGKMSELNKEQIARRELKKHLNFDENGYHHEDDEDEHQDDGFIVRENQQQEDEEEEEDGNFKKSDFERNVNREEQSLKSIGKMNRLENLNHKKAFVSTKNKIKNFVSDSKDGQLLTVGDENVRYQDEDDQDDNNDDNDDVITEKDLRRDHTTEYKKHARMKTLTVGDRTRAHTSQSVLEPASRKSTQTPLNLLGVRSYTASVSPPRDVNRKRKLNDNSRRFNVQRRHFNNLPEEMNLNASSVQRPGKIVFLSYEQTDPEKTFVHKRNPVANYGKPISNAPLTLDISENKRNVNNSPQNKKKRNVSLLSMTKGS
ncbi:hypothetical protein AKO1_014438 [Acrasis kona]|uniref:Uncharacterized protein n=1 Tax=Acrasis kona TaxID=1008807 RepID=A0AAW2Z088_9EUKA